MGNGDKGFAFSYECVSFPFALETCACTHTPHTRELTHLNLHRTRTLPHL